MPGDTVKLTLSVAMVYPLAEAVTVELYVPASRPEELIPKDSDPRAGEGNTSQLLLADLLSVTVGVPVLAERVEVLFAVEPFCTTEKESDVGEKDKAGAVVTVSVTLRVALA